MKLPTRKECFNLLKEYRLFENMQRHSLQVNRIANLLAKKLKEKDIDVDLELVDRASLLHDLDKFHTLKDKKNHGFVAADILKRKGYKGLAVVVNKHILSSVLTRNKPKTWEEKIVYYADKVVKGDKIVSLKTRFSDLKKRYGVINKKVMGMIVKSEPLVCKLEKEIFKKLDIKPKNLKNINN